MPWLKADIELHAACGFPSWNPQEDPFREDDFTANFIVRAIKRDETRLKGRWMRLRGRRITVDNYLELHDRWFEWAAKRINRFVGNPVLVAIPNSGATPDKATFATRDLALGISKASGANWPVYDGLRFRQQLQPSSRGGRRDKEFLYAEMLALGALPEGKSVLIDDVCTVGGHLFAAQRLLALPNGTHAIVCGRTVHARREKMVGNIDETISDRWWLP